MEMELKMLMELKEDMFALGMAAVLLERVGEYEAGEKCRKLKDAKEMRWNELMFMLTGEQPDAEIPDLND